VRGRRQGNIVSLEIGDNGKGMSPEVLASLTGSVAQVGVGIRGMRERARQLGGKFRIKSDGTGTTIIVAMPIRESSRDDEYRARGLAPVARA